MPYNSLTSRTDAAALIPEEVSAVLLQDIEGSNPIMQLARKLPNMSRAQLRMPVLASLATAYFVDGDTGLKQTTELTWENKYVDAAEVAAIVPIPESVLDDADYDIWSQVRPELVRAFNKAIVQAVLYGTNIPSTWTTNLGAAGLVEGSDDASHTISAAAYTDLYEAIMGAKADGTDGQLMLIEADGFMVNGHVAHVSFRGMLRNVRDADGNPIFTRSMQDRTRYDLDGVPVFFPLDGSIVAASSLDIAGDWSQLVYAMRQDMTYKILTEAVIQDASGNIVYNLAQQDMVALRAVMRLGFALPNPINAMNETAATRFPFSVLTA
jgi:HK97 family phage major capsid protein